MSLERPGAEGYEQWKMPGSEREKDREKEAERRTFEYRDRQNNLIGSAELELAPEEVEVPLDAYGKKEKGRGRELKSFVLRGKKGGSETSVDVIALINRHKTKIIVANERLDNYAYLDKANEAVVASPQTPLDIGVMFHELGHADQHHEERFDAVTPMYESGKSATADVLGTFADVRQKVEAVIAAVPEAARMLNPETMQELESMQREKNRLWDKRDGIEERLSAQKAERDRVVQEALGRALTGALPEGFAADVERTFNALGENWDENMSQEKGDEYVAALEKAGIRFGPEPALAAEKPKNTRRFISFADDGEPAKSEKPFLARSEVKGVEQARILTQRFRNGVNSQETQMSYAAENGRLEVSLPFPDGSTYWNRKLRLELPMSPEDHAAFDAAREAADASVAATERQLADAVAELTAAGNAYRERVGRSNLADILKLPQRMLERDATRRAYQWLRLIRQEAGIDLFAAHDVPREATVGAMRESRQEKKKGVAGECEDSAATVFEDGAEDWIETDVLTGLGDALSSYGAEFPPLNKREK